MKNAKGFVLITSYLLLSVLSIFSLALFSRSNVFLQATERNQNKTVAFNMAEAGLDTAIFQLRANPAYAGSGGYVPMQTNTVQGGYQVTVTTPATTPTGQPNTNAAIRQITATGFSPTNTVTDRAYETRTVTGYVNVAPPSLFDYAVFADKGINIHGNVEVDSYDTRVNPVYDRRNAGSNADIGTNNSITHTANFSGGVSVRGDGFYGVGGDLDVYNMSNNVQFNGTISGLSAPKELPPPEPTGTNLGTLRINDSYPLPAGEYRASSLKITGQGQLVADGPVKIYVSGEITIEGKGVATSGELPKNMLIYATGDADVKLGGSSKFYGAVYAPKSNVKVHGDNHFFGGFVAGEFLHVGNAKFHFDEALKDVESDSGGQVSILSWTENNTSLGS